MTERPILFTPGNVRAILDGTKTQTRRIVKPEPWEVMPVKSGGPPWPHSFRLRAGSTTNGDPVKMLCPFGTAEDRLWVREGLERSKNLIGVSYRRDGKPVGPMPTGGWYRWEWRRDTLSPIHMPKWACRLWLEIVEVRVERLQEISEEDAIAEGVQPISGHPYSWKSYRFGKAVASDVHCEQTARDSYRTLWESINGAGSWGTNPWVWAITFKRVKS